MGRGTITWAATGYALGLAIGWCGSRGRGNRRRRWTEGHVSRGDGGQASPKFDKYKIWGPITNLGPVSESKKRSGKTSQNPVAHFFRGPLSGS